jgi:hypothetical protein
MIGFCAPAFAQPQTAPGTPDAASEQEAKQPVQTKDQVAAVIAKARDCYRKGQTAERVSLRVSWPDGREAKSTVTFLFDNGVPDLGWSHRLRLELGRLTVYADDSNLSVVNSQDPATIFTAALPEGLTLSALRGVLPPIPLPQLAWALEDPKTATDPGAAVPGAGPITWAPLTTETRTHVLTFRGEAPGGAVSLSIDPNGELVAMSGPYGPKGAQDYARLDIEVIRVPAAEITPVDQWTITTAGRVPVGFLAELRGKAPEIVTGDRMPALSLMNVDMSAASLQGLLTPRQEGPLPSTRPSFGALIVYRAQGSAPSDGALAGVRAVGELKSQVASRWADVAKRPRVNPLVIACLDLQECTRSHLAEIDHGWAAGSPGRVYSPSGSAILSRLANHGASALIIVDSELTVLKAIPLDGRAEEDAGVAQEAAKAIADALGP